jgi:hypothetical protein
LTQRIFGENPFQSNLNSNIWAALRRHNQKIGSKIMRQRIQQLPYYYVTDFLL